MQKKQQKQKGKITIARNPKKLSFFVGRSGKAKPVRSAIDGLRQARNPNN